MTTPDWHRQRYVEDLKREIVGCERHLENLRTKVGIEATGAIERAEQRLANAENALKQVTPAKKPSAKKPSAKKAEPVEGAKPKTDEE
jgi:outer membrane protein TolC